MILPAAVDVAITQHASLVLGAPVHGVTIATRGRPCAGSATGRDMFSKTLVSSFPESGGLVATAALRISKAVLPQSVTKALLQSMLRVAPPIFVACLMHGERGYHDQ